MLQKIREKVHQIPPRKAVSVVIGMIPAALFVVFLYYMMAHTFADIITGSASGLSSYASESLSDSFESFLEDNFPGRTHYITLNGLTTKTLGIHTLNGTWLLSNGQLAYAGDISYNEKYSANIVELNEFLNDRGMEFIYVLAPDKRAFYDSAFAPGYQSNAKESFDTMIEVLDAAGVTTIDMNSWFAENGWTMDDVYYKTDHHWNTQAGMAAVRETMELLSNLGLSDYDPAVLDEENWTVTVYEDWYLGYHGKRTGSRYAGADDFLLYEPNFPTNYSYSYIKGGSTVWNYEDTILDLNYLNHIDYFNDNPYCVYMIGDYPNRITVNSEATNNQRVLLMGDSFKMPYEYFLTTQFQEVYTVDLRYCTDGATLAQYVEEFQPDLVIMCSNTINSDDLLYTFGISGYLAALEETNPDSEPASLGDFMIQAGEGSNQVFSVVYTELEPGQTYTLTLEEPELSGNEGQYIQMTLQDISSNKSIVNRYFDANSDDTQKWIFSVPESADTYAIFLYAGTKGATSGNSAVIKNVQLYEGICE